MADERFPDVQLALIELITQAGLVPANRAATKTPADLGAKLPFVRIVRVAGDRTRLNDRPTVTLDVFAATYAAAEPLAERITNYLTTPLLPPTAGGVIDRVEVIVAPVELPWGEAPVRRFGTTLRVISRKHRNT